MEQGHEAFDELRKIMERYQLPGGKRITVGWLADFYGVRMQSVYVWFSKTKARRTFTASRLQHLKLALGLQPPICKVVRLRTQPTKSLKSS